MFLQPSDGLSGHIFFDLSGEAPDLDTGMARSHDQVDVFWHDDPCPEVNRPGLTLFLQCVHKPLSGSVAVQKMVIDGRRKTSARVACGPH